MCCSIAGHGLLQLSSSHDLIKNYLKIIKNCLPFGLLQKLSDYMDVNRFVCLFVCLFVQFV